MTMHPVAISVLFLAIYSLVNYAGLSLLAADLDLFWALAEEKSYVVKFIIFGIAPVAAMLVGGAVAAEAVRKDPGWTQPHKFFGSFWLGFAISWLIIVFQGVHLICGSQLESEWWQYFGTAGAALGGVVAPLISLAAIVAFVRR